MIVGESIQEQTRQCLENVSAILQAAGISVERVVTIVNLIEESEFAGMNEEWGKWFRRARQRGNEQSYRFEFPV
jgi:2-iminobutanoate/2-iminopropanoate deaminase